MALGRRVLGKKTCKQLLQPYADLVVDTLCAQMGEMGCPAEVLAEVQTVSKRFVWVLVCEGIQPFLRKLLDNKVQELKMQAKEMAAWQILEVLDLVFSTEFEDPEGEEGDEEAGGVV